MEELLKEYHNALVDNGVKDFTWTEFQNEFEMILVDELMTMLSVCNMMKPKTFLNFFEKMLGDKNEGFMKLIGNSGWFNKYFLLLASLYARDQTNFLLIKK